jgi:hypothetical protein
MESLNQEKYALLTLRNVNFFIRNLFVFMESILYLMLQTLYYNNLKSIYFILNYN